MTDGPTAAAVVLTKVAVPEALAAVCALNRIPVDVVPTDIGAVAVPRAAAPGDPETAAQIISSVLSTTPVVLLVQRDGQVTAGRWSGGDEVEELTAALMLDGAPPEVEAVLLGTQDPRELPDVVASVGMSRFRAMRILARVARATRRAARKGGATPDTGSHTRQS